MIESSSMAIFDPRGDAPSPRERWPRPDIGTEVRGGSSVRVHVVPAVPSHSHTRSGALAETLYRTFEIVFALVGLIAALPVMLLAAIVIRLDSPGPALFLHKRPARSIR